MSQDYNATVNLPKTDFPMRASLPKREPGMLEHWYEMDLYREMLKRNEGKPLFVLHDGPPFSNGYIHMGTALNKCIKDFINRYKSMTGYKVPYTPGWDNHGMPIESAIIKQNKLDRKKMSIPEFRDACHAFAQDFVEKQMAQFKRLGVLGDWDDPYLTMKPEFEAREVRVFGEMFKKGYIYKGKKPVYWCYTDETALAEAEIEYADDPCTSIYVKFPVSDDLGKLGQYCDLSKTFFVIWTTTTWTLPGNLAICVGPRLEYSLVKVPNGEVYILASELVEGVCKVAGIESYEVLATIPGSELEFMRARHPFIERDSIVLCGDHVTLEAGTGCVHTAPGFGADDYFICQKYDREKGTNIGLIVPVDDRGIMTDEVFNGCHIAKANEVVLPRLEQDGLLLAKQEFTHSYPHCWRCKNPVIFRATDQWFCSVEAFKDQAVAACDEVTWMPDWGHDRMTSMIRERADWCISRQRHWGLPIPVFYCEDCGAVVCDDSTIDSVSNIFAQHGSNAWFSMEASELLPKGYVCPKCGGVHFAKETDTLDGWFDSGSTHYASMEAGAPGCWPADLYLEGGDQYRGWFQSSLLTAVATKGKAPYRAGEGRAMHKSLGNSVLPDELIPKYGADLLRLWAASADYRVDMRCSDAIFKQLSDKYLKIRNTARFILGNLGGFDPNSPVAYEDMLPLDKWALTRLNQLIEKCLAAYERYEFFAVTYAIHNFCVVDMSNIYLDILKDRLYCDGENSLERRSGQTAIYIILDSLVRLLAPILAFTSDEIWQAMPHAAGADARHVMLNDMPAVNPAWVLDADTQARWDAVLALRDDVLKALELARAEKVVGKPLDAKLKLFVSESAQERFALVQGFSLETLFIVSEVEVVSGAAPEGGAIVYSGENFPGVTVVVEASEAPKCVRCWTHSHTVGKSAAHPELCERCAKALGE
jgi:isoleucyl-tRNA synthetase